MNTDTYFLNSGKCMDCDALIVLNKTIDLFRIHLSQIFLAVSCGMFSATFWPSLDDSSHQPRFLSAFHH
jgi:hypothetical protein